VKNLLLFVALIASPTSFAADRGFKNGHNVSITSDLLEGGSCAIGLTLVACGISSHVSLGTSLWMIQDYKLANGALRILLDQEEDGDRWAMQASYFKSLKPRTQNTNGAYLYTYQMEALWLMFIRTLELSDRYRLHLNFHTNYYRDERMPFSLRRPSVKNRPTQFNFTLLHQVDLVSGWFIFGEMGLLDLARPPQHIHGGASLGLDVDGFSFHLGFSLTAGISALFSPLSRADYQQQLRFGPLEGYDGEISAERAQYDYSIHPEFSLQYVF